jgi:hypothetical protein
MTQDELSASVLGMKEEFSSFAKQLAELKRLELQRYQDEEERRKKQESEHERQVEIERRKAEQELSEWQEKQSFWSQHGSKILGVLFATCSAGLAWYGAQIRAEIDAEQQAAEIERAIDENKRGLAEFKQEAKDDIKELRRTSVNQTLVIDEGFDRIDKIILKVHPKQIKEEELPDAPLREEAVKEAKTTKQYIDNFGEDSVPRPKE